MTAKNASYSYPAKLRKIAIYLPLVSMLILAVFVFDYFVSTLKETPGLTLIYALVFITFLELIFIIAALFHGQCRDRIARPFDNPTSKNGWGYFMVVATGLGSFFGIVIKALFELFLIALRSDVPTSSSTSNYSGESEQERDEREYGSGLVDDYGKYKD